MKVIVAHDDPTLGKKGDVITVSDGHVANYLLPHKKVILATPEALARFERMRKKAHEERRAFENQRENITKQIAGKVVHIHTKTRQGTLFGAIHARQIAQALKTQYAILIDEDAISLPEPIKKIGTYAAVAAFGKGAQATFTVSVMAEE